MSASPLPRPLPVNGTAPVNKNGTAHHDHCDSGPDSCFRPMSPQELQAASEARAARRARFAALVTEAGMDPAELDITKIMSDEEQAQAIERMAAERRARDLAKQGRAALRERLKKTVEIHSAVCERTTGRFDTPREPNGSS